MLATAAAHDLMRDGAIALARCEANGICIDRKRLLQSVEQCKEIEHRLDRELRSDVHGDIWSRMRRNNGQRAKLTSGRQLGHVLYGELKYPVISRTRTGQPSTDEESLSEIPLDWVMEWGHLMKIRKVSGTYLKGILRETQRHEDLVTKRMMWLLHPIFQLHTTDTYRSSCADPNFQNMPVRNPTYSEFIRSCIVPRYGDRCLIEIDFGGAEVRVAASYHRDPRMIAYLETGADWHKEMAAECFLLKPEQVTKTLRNTAKGMFTFAAFYGDWWWSISRNLYDAVRRGKMTTEKGTLILDWLKKKGIDRLGEYVPDDKNPDLEPDDGTFQKHIRQVEKRFWEERFPVYDEWRKKLYWDYKERGEFMTHTGFHVEGVFKRNKVINNPVQGSSFHCLLWALCRLQKLIDKYKLRVSLLGQIHDSIVADGHKDDIPKFLELAKRVIEIELKQHFPWLVTGMIAEAKISKTREEGGSWFTMKEMAL